MMERDFIAQKTKETHIKQYLKHKLHNVGLAQIKLKKIPLGEKIIIYTSRPGLIIGSKGANIKDITRYLKKEFKLENPQIEISEIKKPFLDAQVVAERISSSLEKFGSARFKSIGHKTIENIMKSGALGVEIILSGKIPGARSKSWRFYEGYLKKCGDISLSGVDRAKRIATLRSGIIGIKVAIMPPDIKLPDKIEISEEPIEINKEVKNKKEKKNKIKKSPKKKKIEKKKKAEEKKEAEKKEIEKTPEEIKEEKEAEEIQEKDKKAEEEIKDVAKEAIPSPEETVEKDKEQKS